VSAKIIPRLLTAQQKEHHLSVASDLLNVQKQMKTSLKNCNPSLKIRTPWKVNNLEMWELSNLRRCGKFERFPKQCMRGASSNSRALGKNV
jgi:hypothetical protein